MHSVWRQWDKFRFRGGKKIKEIPLGSIADLEYLKSLAADKKLKLSGTDLLFVLEGLKKWDIEQRKYGYKYEASGLGIKIIEDGTGELPASGQTVKVHYTGYLEDGTKFDSSRDRNSPFSFPLGKGGVIKGWDEGVAKLKKGTKAWLRIPPDLGYGSTARGKIPANAVLYFEIEIL